MANFQLPPKWCILRTDENFKTINAWLNKKYDNPNAYEKSGGWITNDTQRNVKPPNKNRPSSYTEISFEQFEQYVLGLAKSTLPTYWIFQYLGNRDCMTVLEYINKKTGFNLKGKNQQWYGFDGQFRVRFESIDFDNNPTILTSKEIVAKIAPETEEVRLPAPAGRPAPQAAPAVYLVGHKLIKVYPGSKAVGYTTLNEIGINPQSGMFNYAEYWEPIFMPLPQVGQNVSLLSRPNGWHDAIGTIYPIVRVDPNGNNIPNVVINRIGVNTNVDIRNFELQPIVPETIVGNFRVKRIGEVINIRVNGDNAITSLTRGDLTILNRSISATFVVSIGTIPARLTRAEIDRMLAI